MTNLLLFVLTVAAYLATSCMVDMLEHKNTTKHTVRTRLVWLAFLCVPFNINGHVFTVLGNATSEKNILSICSLYQKAGRDTINIFGLAGYQKAGRDTANIFGLVSYQKAGRETLLAIGIAGYQNAGQKATTVAGITGYQKAGQGAEIAIGVAVYQKVKDKDRSFGAFSKLSSE